MSRGSSISTSWPAERLCEIGKVVSICYGRTGIYVSRYRTLKNNPCNPYIPGSSNCTLDNFNFIFFRSEKDVVRFRRRTTARPDMQISTIPAPDSNSLREEVFTQQYRSRLRSVSEYMWPWHLRCYGRNISQFCSSTRHACYMRRWWVDALRDRNRWNRNNMCSEFVALRLWNGFRVVRDRRQSVCRRHLCGYFNFRHHRSRNRKYRLHHPFTCSRLLLWLLMCTFLQPGPERRRLRSELSMTGRDVATGDTTDVPGASLCYSDSNAGIHTDCHPRGAGIVRRWAGRVLSASHPGRDFLHLSFQTHSSAWAALVHL